MNALGFREKTINLTLDELREMMLNTEIGRAKTTFLEYHGADFEKLFGTDSDLVINVIAKIKS